MDFVFLMHFIVIFGCSTNCRIQAVPKNCKNESCLNKSLNINSSGKTDSELPLVEISEPSNFANLRNEKSENKIYELRNLKKAYGIALSKDNYVYKLQKETNFSTETPDDLLYFSPYYIENLEGMNNGTSGVLEVTEINFEDVTNTTFHPISTEKATIKLNVLPTQNTPLASHLFKRNFKLGKSTCFCDVKVNECDINCCCDEDCSLLHLKVFTKCIDDTFFEDTKYCYNDNYLIFGNNISHKIVEKQKGLFCIAKKNIKISLNYESKQTLTTLEAFNKSLPNKLYGFSYKTEGKSDFMANDYVTGSLVWTIQNGQVIPFNIPYSAVGFLCNSKMNIKYLVDDTTTCFLQLSHDECGSNRIKDVLHDMGSTKIISSPTLLNKTQISSSSKICEIKACIQITSYLCWSFDDTPKCIKQSKNYAGFSDIGCGHVISNIQYQILHNGSGGILKVEAQLWIRKLPKILNNYMFPFTTDVQYSWLGSTEKAFKRSGNPGYITGKPVLAGQKIYKSDETSDKKEAIELSANPNNWLSVLGSEKGICSFEKRIPIYFRENGQFMCFLKLGRNNFTKDKCVELQNNIFKLLLGQDLLNSTKDNYFNKFVATFGNSQVENTGDWVRVLIDLFPLSTSQTGFKSNHYFVTCKNIITDLYINIVYSKIGSILTPQAKILGVSFQFGEHKDLTYHCGSPGCENTSFIRDFKLSSSVRFIDITKPATDAFAEPLHLEIKLPHDFFYPFFSKAHTTHVFCKFLFILVFPLTFIKNFPLSFIKHRIAVEMFF